MIKRRISLPEVCVTVIVRFLLSCENKYAAPFVLSFLKASISVIDVASHILSSTAIISIKLSRGHENVYGDFFQLVSMISPFNSVTTENVS